MLLNGCSAGGEGGWRWSRDVGETARAIQRRRELEREKGPSGARKTEEKGGNRVYLSVCLRVCGDAVVSGCVKDKD
jgi:hypothetical protein